jgi:hypothetical protein
MAWRRLILAEHGLGRGRGKGMCGAEGGKARQAGAAARVVVQLAAEKLNEVLDLVALQRWPAVPDQLLRQKLHACACIRQQMYMSVRETTVWLDRSCRGPRRCIHRISTALVTCLAP